MKRFVAGAALAVLALSSGSRPLAAQEGAVRFEITNVSDSTFTFPVGRNRWVSKRQRGIAVDPRRRDVLVARFRVLRVESGTATALITGETTRLEADDVALLERPRPRFYQRAEFWMGAAIGAAVGLGLGAL
jgi:hypothetical protein